MTDTPSARQVIAKGIPEWWNSPRSSDLRTVVTSLADILNPVPQSAEEAALMAAFPMAGGIVKNIPLELARPFNQRLLKHYPQLLWEYMLAAMKTGTTGREHSVVAGFPSYTPTDKKMLNAMHMPMKPAGQLDITRAVGNTQSVNPQVPFELANKRATTIDMHTHPTGSHPIYSSGDVNHAEYKYGKRIEGLSNDGRPFVEIPKNKEFVVVGPDQQYSWFRMLNNNTIPTEPTVYDYGGRTTGNLDFATLEDMARRGEADLQYMLKGY